VSALTGNITQRHSREANIARVVHECKQSFNWLLVANNSVHYILPYACIWLNMLHQR